MVYLQFTARLMKWFPGSEPALKTAMTWTFSRYPQRGAAHAIFFSLDHISQSHCDGQNLEVWISLFTLNLILNCIATMSTNKTNKRKRITRHQSSNNKCRRNQMHRYPEILKMLQASCTSFWKTMARYWMLMPVDTLLKKGSKSGSRVFIKLMKRSFYSLNKRPSHSHWRFQIAGKGKPTLPPLFYQNTTFFFIPYYGNNDNPCYNDTLRKERELLLPSSTVLICLLPPHPLPSPPPPPSLSKPLFSTSTPPPLSPF